MSGSRAVGEAAHAGHGGYEGQAVAWEQEEEGAGSSTCGVSGEDRL
eukprot:CAMPEP_0181245512 /NCGR_PEP_ID=MMETSP1096-20121128/43466_1 /TAXON_ID=156174 ORGANISM="Chrysochromulina ericina, Strain CCMP281" /NCGR_SAMPLE_ID=MMETSP1096 /ASSEMBLY_ACC=CAM_ASM_000453 /LENGTH=45 /DNA_ID= /DNA_START= /DNA_END= /DNA_ORIENTATION=